MQGFMGQPHVASKDRTEKERGVRELGFHTPGMRFLWMILLYLPAIQLFTHAH